MDNKNDHVQKDRTIFVTCDVALYYAVLRNV